MKNIRERITVLVLLVLLGPAALAADDAERAMFGGTPSRNMVSDEKGLPTEWDPETGLNVKWVAELGSQTYAGPVVAGGKVYVGTNNQREYNPKVKGDRGNVMAFRTADGELAWQSAHPKLGAGRVNDWPLQGVCSTPFVEGDRVYYVSNRAEVVCADTEGFRDGENDGPYTDEGETVQTAEGSERLPLTSEIDEDVVWKFDMIGELDVFPHNLAAGSPLIVGDMLFTVTGQGVDEGHINVPSPLGPSFIALNKKTGKLVWETAAPGEDVLHGSWSNPSYGVIRAKPQVMYPGGDGWLYSLEPRTGKLIWKFNLNPAGSKWELGGRGTKNNVISTPVIHDDKVYIGVGQDPEHGEGPGNFWVIDPEKTGDVTDSAVVWHVGGEEFHRTMSTASIKDGLLYIADLSGFVYCFDVNTGQLHWKYDAFAAIWGSTFVADGKVYIGDEDGDVAVLKAGKKMELLHEVNMGAAVYTTPVAKDGVIYVASRTKLFALEDGIPAKKVETPAPKNAAGKTSTE
jgi:outer membrane protein assembly factor BamB